MKCPNCGAELSSGDKFCVSCGAKIGFENQNQNQNFSSEANSQSAPFQNAPFSTGQMRNQFQNPLGNLGRGVNFMVRRYFFGFGDLLWFSILLLIISLFINLLTDGDHGTVLAVISLVGIVASILMDIYIRLIGMGKGAVDEATQRSMNQLASRANVKFNVDAEQISEIEPIIVSGSGISPSMSSERRKPRIIRKLFNFFKVFSRDPIEVYRIDKFDKIPRYLLVQTTLYAFTDTQLLMYSGNMDISTGMIYDESVTEIFYSDINSVTQRDVLEKFKIGFFKKEYYTLKYLDLDICGIIKQAAFDTRFTENITSSLFGMESYIREKKNR